MFTRLLGHFGVSGNKRSDIVPHEVITCDKLRIILVIPMIGVPCLTHYFGILKQKLVILVKFVTLARVFCPIVMAYKTGNEQERTNILIRMRFGRVIILRFFEFLQAYLRTLLFSSCPTLYKNLLSFIISFVSNI